MRDIVPEPLTAEAFAPFGEVIEASDRAERIGINRGYTTRFNDLARIVKEARSRLVPVPASLLQNAG